MSVFNRNAEFGRCPEIEFLHSFPIIQKMGYKIKSSSWIRNGRGKCRNLFFLKIRVAVELFRILRNSQYTLSSFHCFPAGSHFEILRSRNSLRTCIYLTIKIFCICKRCFYISAIMDLEN